MDVGLGIFWWLELDDKTDALDIKTSGSNVSGNQDIELALLEPLDGGLSLVLRDTSMHHLDILIQGVTLTKHVRVFSSCSEDNHFSSLSVACH